MGAEEIADADADLKALTAQAAPSLLECFGVGPEIAGQLLITAGDNPGRVRSEASFAALCGVSPARIVRTHQPAPAQTEAATAPPTVHSTK